MKVYVFFADGYEEIEALTVVDVLRRGDVDTVMVSIKEDKIVVGAHNILVVADKNISEIEVLTEDMIVLPGGAKGVKGLSESKLLKDILIMHQERSGLLAAICAGPTILGELGFYDGNKATCYPGCEKELKGANIIDEDVVVDKNLITSRGPATALSFAYKLLEIVNGKDVSERIMNGMLYKSSN